MNKRHYEHTLPNIRGSLSNTYGKRQLTVGNYIDNVLKEHFEKHADEVKTYLQKSYNKIF